MTLQEQETNLVFDYAGKVVRVYTTREGVYNGFCRRLGADKVTLIRQTSSDWSFTVPMDDCRGPEAIAKLLNPDEKRPMSEERKQAFRAARSEVA